MKLKVIGKIKEERISLMYRTNIISIIKKVIELGDEDLFKELYFYGNKRNKKIKPFALAVYFKNFKIEDSIIFINGTIEITITTPDYNLGICIYNGFLKLDEYIYNDKILGNITFIKEKVLLEKESLINGEEIICKTLSPIHIRDINNKPLSPIDNSYLENLNYITDVLLKSYRGYGLKRKLEFKPLDMKKVVVKEAITGFIEKSKKDFMYINAYSGTFILNGDNEDLSLILKLGLGYRRSQCFGLIDLI